MPDQMILFRHGASNFLVDKLRPSIIHLIGGFLIGKNGRTSLKPTPTE